MNTLSCLSRRTVNRQKGMIWRKAAGLLGFQWQEMGWWCFLAVSTCDPSRKGKAIQRSSGLFCHNRARWFRLPGSKEHMRSILSSAQGLLPWCLCGVKSGLGQNPAFWIELLSFILSLIPELLSFFLSLIPGFYNWFPFKWHPW